MTFKELDKHEFLEFRKSHTQLETARHYGVNDRTVRNWERQMGFGSCHDATESPSATIAFPANVEHEVLTGHPTIYADKCLVIGDCEIPDHDIKTLEAAIQIAKRFGITQLIINGDFVALDSFSCWARAAVYKIAFKQELEAAHIAMQVFLQTFTEITWLTGNHERRLAHKLDGEVTIGDFFANISGVTFSEYAHAILKSGGHDIFVTHQKNYSIIPLSVPLRLAAIKHMNILCAHGHHLALGYDKSGKYWIAEGGHCRNVENTMYKQIQVTCHPEWNPGFIMILNGRPFLIDHENIDLWLTMAPLEVA